LPDGGSIFVIGGAAGLLTRELPASHTTADVDILPVALSIDEPVREVGRKLNLPPSWLSDDCGVSDLLLPRGWRRRVKLILKSGKWKVHAVGRRDLIFMKMIANRARDREHLQIMRPTEAELDFVEHELKVLLRKKQSEHQRAKLTKIVQNLAIYRTDR
jgi:hypothetical protein